MTVEQIQMSCTCGCANGIFFTATKTAKSSEAKFLQAWKNDAAGGGHVCYCRDCGCTYRTIDDGNPVGSGGNITLQNESQPRADSISAGGSGSTAGGTSVTVEGHGFNVATPTVKFDGTAGTNVNVVSDTQLTVDSPAGAIKLNIAEMHTKLSHGSVTGGPYQVGETVTGGTSSATGVVTEQQANYLMVKTVTGEFVDAEVLTGGTSSATATTDADPSVPTFSVGETITGQSSAVTSTCQDIYPKVDTLSGSYTADEDVLGGTSGARATLDSTPMDGFVDVSIENTWGAHSSTALLHHDDVTGGPFEAGETLTGGTSGKTAVVVRAWDRSCTVENVSGPFTAGETLTGGTSSGTADYVSLIRGTLVGSFDYTP